MEDLRASIARAQQSDATAGEIQAVLLLVQRELNYACLRTHGVEAVESLLGEIWRFLLFSASHSTSSVRLSSYRATGIFLLKITPYFPRQIQNTFSKVSEGSTVDLKSSAVIAASFAFISQTVAFPYLEQFLDTTPVYHDFAISDPIFSEHLGAIISHIGNVGLDWFRTLLHSFLALVATSADRYLLWSIVAIVKHHPYELVCEILQFVKEQASVRVYLSLVSFVLTSLKRVRFDDFDLLAIAMESLTVLENASEANLTEIDSAMQILSIQSKSFTLTVEEVDNDNVRLVLSGQETKEITFNITPYRNRTAFFLLGLPLRYTEPDLERDGALTLTAKLCCMAQMVCKHPEMANSLLAVVEANIEKEYCDIVSACIQAVSKCLPVLLERCERSRVVLVLERVIFAAPANWFHAADILRILDAVSVDQHESLFGNGADLAILDVWIRLSMGQNEVVGKKAVKSLVAAVREESFEKVTERICERVDAFDRLSVIRLIPLLSLILDKFPHGRKEHMRETIWLGIESCALYQDDIQVLTVVFEFLSHFEIDFPTERLSVCIDVMLAVIAAEVNMLAGELWFDSKGSPLVQSCVETVETTWQAMNLDIISDEFIGFDSCMKPLLAALKLFTAIAPQNFDDATILRVCISTLAVFPRITATLLDRQRDKLSLVVRQRLFENVIDRLKCVQDYDIAALLCKQYILFESDYKDIVKGKGILTDVVEFAVRTTTSVNCRQMTVFRAFLKVVGETSEGLYEEDVLTHCKELYPLIFKKELPESKEIVDDGKSDFAVFSFSEVTNERLTTIDIENLSLVNVQLNRKLCEFPVETLEALLARFCEARDAIGVENVLKYASLNRVLVNVDKTMIPQDARKSFLLFKVAMECPDVVDLVTEYMEDSSTELVVSAIGVNPERYLQSLSEKDRVSKRDLRILTIALNSVAFDSEQLKNLVMKWFKVIESKKKLSYLLILLEQFLLSNPTFPSESVTEVMEIIQKRSEDLPSVWVARCVKSLLPFIPSQSSAVFDHYLSVFGSISPMLQLLYVCASELKDRVSLFERDVPSKAEELLKSRVPSNFSSGVRLFVHALEHLPGKRIQSLLKHCLGIMIQTWPQFMDVFGIADEIGASFATILKSQQFKKFHSQILQNASKIIPTLSHAAFVSVSPCLIQLSTQSLIDEQVVERIRQLVTNPMCVPLMEIFVNIVDIAAQKLGQSEGKSYVKKTAERWVDRNLKKFDCCNTAEILLLWCKILHKYNTIDDSSIATRVFANSNRFFPCFVGLARFATDVETFKGHLKDACRDIECRAHRVALQLILDPQTARDALRLAAFDGDCEASSVIIAKFDDQHFI